MVKKGLKVGETFTDGNFLYKVLSVDELGNYTSSLVDKASEGDKPKKVVVAKVVDEVKETNYDDMPYSELKKSAKEKGVSAKGSKEELLERLKKGE